VPANALIIVVVDIFANGNATHTFTGSEVSDGSTSYGVVDQGILNSTNGSGKAIMFWGNTVAGLAANATISFTNQDTSSRPTAISALYATGGLTTSSVLDTAASTMSGTSGNLGYGTGTSPTAQMRSAPVSANSLIVAITGWRGASTDSFTQSSGGWAVPPVAPSFVTNAALAGGYIIGSSQVSYSPTITSHDWAVLIGVFKPSIVAACGGLALLGVGC
jgi:hypothetical protein